MNLKRPFLFVCLLCGPFHGPAAAQDTAQFQVTARIRPLSPAVEEPSRETSDGVMTQTQPRVGMSHRNSDKLIPKSLLSASSTVVRSGSTATFADQQRFQWPTAWDAPILASSLQERVADTDAWTFHESDATLPPHPRNFEWFESGLDLKVKPVEGDDGNVRVEVELHHVRDHGFSTATTTIALEGRDPDRRNAGEFVEQVPLNSEGRIQSTENLSEDGKLSFTLPASAYEGSSPDLDLAGFPGLVLELEILPVEISSPSRVAEAGDFQISLTTKYFSSEDAIPEQFQGILTEPQFQFFSRSMSQQKGIDILSAPTLLARTGEPVKVEIMREFTYPVEYAAPVVVADDNPDAFPVTPIQPKEFGTLPMGLSLAVTPTINSSGSIDLTFSSRVSEFRDHLNAGQPILQPRFGVFGGYRPIVISENKVLLPRYQESESTTVVRLSPGQTIVNGWRKSTPDAEGRGWIWSAMTVDLLEPAGLSSIESN